MFEKIYYHDGEDHGAHSKPSKPSKKDPTPATLPRDPSPLPNLGEHTALHHLLRYADVTIYSVKSGCWCETDTWNLGRLPNENDRVLINEGHVVTIDETGDVALTLRVDGTLEFNRTTNTELRVETLGNFGTLEIGTSGRPIDANVQARIVFRDTGPLDASSDPLLQGRGLISYGEVRIYGAEKTPFARLDTGVDTADGGDEGRLHLQEVPADWRVGDTLLVPGTTHSENQDELVTVVATDDSGLRVEPPLRFPHPVASPDAPLMTDLGESDTEFKPDESRRQFVPIANLSRNVTLESENAGDIRRRAHVMLMGLSPVATCYAHFKN
ncbi:MAG TPA: G8 domain-containing protein, partial [Abditibacterium sp.]